MEPTNAAGPTTEGAEVAGGPESAAPDFGRHNMVALGMEHLYLSHLPMFMAPHDYQVVLGAEIVSRLIESPWVTERREHPEVSLYTMAPEEFPLTTLFRPDPPTRSTFHATFFRGHLERGGTPVPQLLKRPIQVTTIFRAEQFGIAGKRDDLTYFLFGGGDEIFLAHVVTEPPDFDQLLSVRLVGPRPTDADLVTGVELVFPGRANHVDSRLQTGESARGRGHVTGAHSFLHLEMEEVREFYLEEGELSSLEGSFRPTDAEDDRRLR